MSEEPADDDAEPAADEVDESEDAAPGSDLWTRETAPQTPYTMRQVGIGLVVLVIGAVVAFGIPLLLT